MRTKSLPTKQKQHGVVYTPPGLATAVAERLVSFMQMDGKRAPIVSDPACGDGSLLDAFGNAADKVGMRAILKGFDLDPAAVLVARERLSKWPNSLVEQKDFLEGRSRTFDLFHTSSPDTIADAFIANPPYVRTQVLGAEQAQDLAARFNLGGRVDLAYAFCMAMIDAMPDGGHFAFIVSNKFMTIKAGASLRRYFEANTEIAEVWDLGDSKLFSAAVLPAVIFGRRRPGAFRENAPFKSMYTTVRLGVSPIECNNDTELLDCLLKSDATTASYANEVLELRRGTLQVKAKEHIWLLQDAAVTNVQTHLSKSRSRQFSDVFETKVGVKTTADKIFIRSDWKLLPEAVQPEPELLWPLRVTADAVRWVATSPEVQKYQILYPYARENGPRQVIDIDAYPRAKAYFETHRAVLEGRTYVIQAGRKWFEPWVAHQPQMWFEPRVVFPEISPTPIFAVDHPGVVPNGTMFWMRALSSSETELLHAAVAIANTPFAVEYYDLMMGTKLYASRRRWNSQHVGSLPFPAADADVQRFSELYLSALDAAKADDAQLLNTIEDELDCECRRILSGNAL